MAAQWAYILTVGPLVLCTAAWIHITKRPPRA
jgi:hypothetical protein